MTSFKSISLLCVLSTIGFTPVASADITGIWNLQGILRIDSAVKGKTITVKNAFPAVASFDTVDSSRQFNLKNNAFELPGQWSVKQNKFSGTPDAAAVRALLNVIKKDLSARSNLPVSLEAGKWTLTGKETKAGKSTKLSGTLTIKAKTFFQGYATKKGEPYSGSLNITYVFTGVRA